MKKDLTELVFILDRSGSMYGLESDTIGGFNSMIEKQKKGIGEVLVNTVVFSDTSKVIMDRKEIKDVPRMDETMYSVGGCTALLDAIGGAIHHVDMVHRYIRKEDVPEHTMFIITTDGMENASRKYSLKMIKQMIEEKKEQGWEFLFLGANIDAVQTAERFGISEEYAVNYHSDAVGTAKNYEALGEAIRSVREEGEVKRSWRRVIDDDFNGRK